MFLRIAHLTVLRFVHLGKCNIRVIKFQAEVGNSVLSKTLIVHTTIVFVKILSTI